MFSKPKNTDFCCKKGCSTVIKYSPECTETHYFQMKDPKNFWGGGTAPSPDPSPLGEGSGDGAVPPPQKIF